MFPDDLNAREAARLAEKRRKRDEALAHQHCCPNGSCGVTYRLEDGEPEDSIPKADPEMDKALRDLFIGVAIAATYMIILMLLLVLL